MKTMKVLMLGGEAVCVVEGGCVLVDVPFMDANPGFVGLGHMRIPVEGGVPVAVEGGSGIDVRVVDYRAEVRAYVDSVPEGGLLIPGWRKVIEEDTVIRAFDSGDYGITLYFDGDDDHGEDWYGVYTFLRLDLRSNL